MKAKDAETSGPRAWAFLRNVLRGHMQTQRESCDHPTALPTVSVFSCHSPSHTSLAKHKAPSTVISPYSVHLHLLLPSGQVRFGCSVGLFCWQLPGGPFQFDSSSVLMCGSFEWRGQSEQVLLTWHSFTVDVLLCMVHKLEQGSCVYREIWSKMFLDFLRLSYRPPIHDIPILQKEGTKSFFVIRSHRA